MSEFVKIVEVGPRDGLQNESAIVPTDIKKKYIDLLLAAKFQSVEVTSFVNPKAIPQMQDSVELFKKVSNGQDLSRLSCLVPNERGMEDAIKLKVKSIAVFTSTSETFNKKNINATVEESFERIHKVMIMAKNHNISVRGYLSTAFGCPYEGTVSINKVVELSQKLIDLGCYEVSVSDTIGIATPELVEQTLREILKKLQVQQVALHFHDTRHRALENITKGLEFGVRTFDASSGGLGGCPYANGATGNVATEQVLKLLNKLDYEHGVDESKLQEASQFILPHLGKAVGV